MRLFGKKAKANSAANGAVVAGETTSNMARESSNQNMYANIADRQPTYGGPSSSQVRRETPPGPLPVGKVMGIPERSSVISSSSSGKSSIISESELKMPAVARLPPPLPAVTKLPPPSPAVTKLPPPLPEVTKLPPPLPEVTKLPPPLPEVTKLPPHTVEFRRK